MRIVVESDAKLLAGLDAEGEGIHACKLEAADVTVASVAIQGCAGACELMWRDSADRCAGCPPPQTPGPSPARCRAGSTARVASSITRHSKSSAVPSMAEKPHAEVIRQPAQKQPLQAPLAQVARQAGWRVSGRSPETPNTNRSSRRNPCAGSARRGEPRALDGTPRRACSARNGPATAPADRRARDVAVRARARMRAGKRNVPGRMPVLGQYHVRNSLRQRVDDGHNLVAAFHRQRAAGMRQESHSAGRSPGARRWPGVAYPPVWHDLSRCGQSIFL